MAHGFVYVFFVGPSHDFETIIVDLDVRIIFFLVKLSCPFAPRSFTIFKCSDDDSPVSVVRINLNTSSYSFRFVSPIQKRIWGVLIYLFPVPALAAFKICDRPSLWLIKVENFSVVSISGIVDLESRRVFDVLYNRIFLCKKHVSFIFLAKLFAFIYDVVNIAAVRFSFNTGVPVPMLKIAFEVSKPKCVQLSKGVLSVL